MSKLFKLAVAAVGGFVAGILLAPKSGKETRDELKAKAEEAKKNAIKKADELDAGIKNMEWLPDALHLLDEADKLESEIAAHSELLQRIKKAHASYTRLSKSLDDKAAKLLNLQTNFEVVRGLLPMPLRLRCIFCQQCRAHHGAAAQHFFCLGKFAAAFECFPCVMLGGGDVDFQVLIID